MTIVLIKAKFLAGTRLDEAVRVAKELAQKLDAAITFRFNGVSVTVFPFSDVEEVVADYEDEMKRMAERKRAKFSWRNEE